VSTIETVLVFVGIPAVVVAVIAGLVYGGSARRARRYRPGRPFEFTPVWFLAAPGRQHASAGDGGSAARAVSGANRLALTKAGSAGEAGEWPGTDPGLQPGTGGASDRW
jgi:hypothetical protein